MKTAELEKVWDSHVEQLGLTSELLIARILLEILKVVENQ